MKIRVQLAILTPALIAASLALSARPVAAIAKEKVMLPPDCQYCFLGDTPNMLNFRNKDFPLPPGKLPMSTQKVQGYWLKSIFNYFITNFDETGTAAYVLIESRFTGTEIPSKIPQFLNYVIANYGPPDLLTVNRRLAFPKPELVWSAEDRRIRASYTPTPWPQVIPGRTPSTDPRTMTGHFTLVINKTGWPKSEPGWKPAAITREEGFAMLAQCQAEVNRYCAVQKKYPVEITF